MRYEVKAHECKDNDKEKIKILMSMGGIKTGVNDLKVKSRLRMQSSECKKRRRRLWITIMEEMNGLEKMQGVDS